MIEKTGILAPNEAKAAFHRIAGRDARYKNSIPLMVLLVVTSFVTNVWAREAPAPDPGWAFLTPSRVYA